MTTMMCSSSFCLGLVLTSLGPAEGPTDPPSSEGDLITDLKESSELSTRAEQMYERAEEYAAKGQYHDASEHIVRAYVLLVDEDRFGPSGLELLRTGVVYHLHAYRQAKDDALLDSIHPLIERFLENHQGSDPKVDGLRRDLQTIRELRLSASRRYFEDGKFTKAASEARACYEQLQAVDKARAIGEEAALAASRAYREAWYLDGDPRHLDAALAVVDDHLAKAGDLASAPAKRERRRLGDDLRRARMSRAARHEEGALSPRDRTFLLAIGAGLGSGVALSAGAAAIGAQTFEEAPGALRPVQAQPGLMTTAIGLSLAGGVVAGLASHALVDASFVSPRKRKLLAVSTTAVALVGSALGATLLTIGNVRDDDRDGGIDLPLQRAGFSVLVGMSAPLGVGIAAIVSRWNSR
jgi:hypothetical protein